MFKILKKEEITRKLKSSKMELVLVVAMKLVYKLLMPFVAWLVPKDTMNNAANYIERTEQPLPTKEVVKWLLKHKKHNTKKNRKK